MAIKAIETEIKIERVDQPSIKFCILGTSPLICHRMSQKSQIELLSPSPKKGATEKASTLKHEPLIEYRDSSYTSRDDSYPTRIQALSVWFKKAMASAALDMPGTAKAQILRLIHAEGERVALYGKPLMLMAIAKPLNSAPDVRTRTILPEWACEIVIKYTKPILREQSVVNLLSAAGVLSGVGDWRLQKGGQYGGFKIVNTEDPDFLRVKQFGRKAQDAALAEPEFYDDETETLYAAYQERTKLRGFKAAA